MDCALAGVTFRARRRALHFSLRLRLYKVGPGGGCVYLDLTASRSATGAAGARAGSVMSSGIKLAPDAAASSAPAPDQ